MIRSHRRDGDAAMFRELGVWGDRTLAEIVADHGVSRPDKTAVIDQHVRWTYAELIDKSLRVARMLHDLGVRSGDRVVAQVQTSAVLPLVHLASNWLGAVFIPASDGWRRAEMGSLLATSGAKVLICAAASKSFDLVAMHEELRPSLPDLKATLWVRTGAADSFESRLETAEPLSAADRVRLRPDPDAPAHVMVSSGTTGIPKAGAWGGNDMVALLLHHFAPAIGLTGDDVAGGLAPANVGSTGYAFPVLAPLLVGATSVVLERWSPRAALALLEAERCTYATAIPTQMAMLLDEPGLATTDLSALTRFNNAGAPLPRHVAERVERRMGCRVQTAYGSSDGGLPTLTSIHDPDDARLGSVGRTPLGQELQLRDPLGEPVATGAEGEVWWRGANKSYGYVNQPDYEAAAWDDAGWYRSGDLARIDEHGYLWITGRAKDMILRAGANIFPAEIESVLATHPDVVAAAVVGVPHDRLGEQACAIVVPRATAAPTLDELTAFLTEQGLARFKLPEQLLLVEELPVNMGGKVNRAELRRLAIQRPCPTV